MDIDWKQDSFTLSTFTSVAQSSYTVYFFWQSFPPAQQILNLELSFWLHLLVYLHIASNLYM